MLGRVKEAVADAAETLRRAFAGLGVTQLLPEPFLLEGRAGGLLTAPGQAGLTPLATCLLQPPLLGDAVRGKSLEPFQGTLKSESGWARWGAEAQVVRMSPLEPGRATRMAVPPLPRQAQARGVVEPLPRPGLRRAADPLPSPGLRRLEVALGRPGLEEGLDTMLSFAVPFRAQDIQRLPKGLWMRYSLQMVRGTGENVRNLEVLGLFRIPRKGVVDLRHDAGGGRILLKLEPAALRAPRAPFILARRKDDGALVSCFVEEP